MRSIIFAAALLIPVSARAEMLLVDIHHVAHQFDASFTMPFNLFAYGLDPQAEWYQQHGTADVGRTFEADQSFVNNLAAHFVYPGALIQTETFNNATRGSVDSIWSGSIPGYGGSGGAATVNTFVPRLGFGLTGYTITRVTETLDDFTLSMNGRYYIADGSQTFRLYGVLTVPEPSTLLLAICGLAWAASSRRK